MAGSLKPTGGLGGFGGARPNSVSLDGAPPQSATSGFGGGFNPNPLTAQVMPGSTIKNFLATGGGSGAALSGFNWKSHGGGLEQNEVLAGMLENSGAVSQDTIEYLIGKAEEPMVKFMTEMARRSPTFFYKSYQEVKNNFILDQDTGVVCPLKKTFIEEINKFPSFHQIVAVQGAVIFGYLLIEEMRKSGKEQWTSTDFKNACDIACYQILFLEMLNWLFTTKKGATFTHRLPKKLENLMGNLEGIKEQFAKMWEMFDAPFPYATLNFVQAVSTPVEYARVFDPNQYGDYLGYVPHQNSNQASQETTMQSVMDMVTRNAAEFHRSQGSHQQPTYQTAASQENLNEVGMTWGTIRNDLENLTRSNKGEYDLPRYFKPIGPPNTYFIPESDWRHIQKVYKRHPDMKQEDAVMRNCFRVVVIDLVTDNGWFSQVVRDEKLDVARVFQNPKLLLPKLEAPEDESELYMVVAAPVAEVANEKLEVDVAKVKELGNGIPAIVIDEQIVETKSAAIINNVNLITNRVTAKFKEDTCAAVFDNLTEWDTFTCATPEDKTRLFLDAPYLFADAALSSQERPSFLDAGRHLKRLFRENVIDNAVCGFINSRLTNITNEWLANQCGYNVVDGKGGGGKLQIDNFVADIDDLAKFLSENDEQAMGVFTDGKVSNYLTQHLQMFYKTNPFLVAPEEMGVLDKIKDDVDLYVIRSFYLANVKGNKGPYYEEANVPQYIKRSVFPEIFHLMEIVVEDQVEEGDVVPEEVYRDKLIRFVGSNNVWLFSYALGDRNVATLRHVDTQVPLVLLGLN